jgi:hypothetical protein
VSPALAAEALNPHKAKQAARKLGVGAASQGDDLVRDEGTPWPPDAFSAAFVGLIRKAGVPVCASTTYGTHTRRSCFGRVCIRRP